MARKPRIEYAGAIYHVMSRGDRQNDIFRDDRDREIFLDTLSESCGRQGWLIHAYVLMGNHYHLLLETPEPNLVIGMKWLQGTYTQRFNSRHKEWGHLFQGRYKALVLQSDQGYYFPTVATYIHLNPVRARLMDFERHPLSEYRWSSFPLYFDAPKRPEWLRVEKVLGCYGWSNNQPGLEGFFDMMQKRTIELQSSKNPEDFDERWKNIRKGWCLGDKNFRVKMDALADKRISHFDRRSYVGAEALKHDMLEAQRLLSFGLNSLGLEPDLLPSLKKNDPQKKVLAWLIRRNTSVKNDWICSRLSMGRSSNLARHIGDVQISKDSEIIRMREMMKKAF